MHGRFLSSSTFRLRSSSSALRPAASPAMAGFRPAGIALAVATVFLGTGHLDSVKTSFQEFYLADRPHQGKDNEVLSLRRRRRKPTQPDEPLAPGDVRCHQWLGGLLKSYHRKAA